MLGELEKYRFRGFLSVKIKMKQFVRVGVYVFVLRLMGN